MSVHVTRSGIYAIIHDAHKAVYVGQSKDSTTSRVTSHWRLLQAGKHSSSEFQRLFNLTTGEGWTWCVLERPPLDIDPSLLSDWLNERELYWHEYLTVQGYCHLSPFQSIPSNRISRLKPVGVLLSEAQHQMLSRLAEPLEWTKGRLLSEYLEHALTEDAIAEFIQWWLQNRLARLNLNESPLPLTSEQGEQESDR